MLFVVPLVQPYKTVMWSGQRPGAPTQIGHSNYIFTHNYMYVLENLNIGSVIY